MSGLRIYAAPTVLWNKLEQGSIFYCKNISWITRFEFTDVFTFQGPGAHVLDDNFFELLSRCQGNRMEEQRAELPKTKHSGNGGNLKCFCSNLLTFVEPFCA